MDLNALFVGLHRPRNIRDMHFPCSRRHLVNLASDSASMQAGSTVLLAGQASIRAFCGRKEQYFYEYPQPKTGLQGEPLLQKVSKAVAQDSTTVVSRQIGETTSSAVVMAGGYVPSPS